MRNPPWKWDELVLALDLYLNESTFPSNSADERIQDLSSILRAMPVHPVNVRNEKFRNPEGVYMKLMNFAHLDPEYAGTGLAAGSKMDQKVWDAFVANKAQLRSVAAAIRTAAGQVTPEEVALISEVDDPVFEGRTLEALHRKRERNARLANKKKKSVLAATGRLACEVCGFDFRATYGDLGDGFAECHHLVPLHLLAGRTRTTQADLAILCANCHRMVHRASPPLPLADLKALIEAHSRNVYDY